MSVEQIIVTHKHGYRYDLYRHGFEFKEEEMSQEELREFYYTKEELAAQKAALKKQFGEVNDL